ncbi:MAG: alpha/beta hydrolase [Bacteroidota bacterium]
MHFRNFLMGFCLVLSTLSISAQGKLITIGKNSIQLYVEDTGKGPAIVFIPGWTMTSKFFQKQKDHYSNNYRFISYDPRSQGESTKTEKGNFYKTHARDLKALLLHLDLNDVILIGWSSGCATIFEYIQLFGTDNINRLVFIDEPPKWIGDTSEDWVYGSFEDYRGSLKDLLQDNLTYAREVVQWMLVKNQDIEEENWMVEQMLKTPRYAALSLYIDGLVSDYQDTLESIDGKIPALYMVRKTWYESTTNWLKTNAPHAKCVAIESHAMFWEAPKAFNQLLDDFLLSPKEPEDR